MSNKILITGGCGFIGSSLIATLLHEDPTTHIRVLDNFITGKPEDLSEICKIESITSSELPLRGFVAGVFLLEGDIRDSNILIEASKGVDCIIHLAANTGVGPSVDDPRLDMDCNVVGTFNVLEAARLNAVNKFIFASSGAPVGEVEPPIHEELAPHPVSPYGASKLAGEGYCSAYYHSFGINTVCLRFGNVYGPRSKKKSSVVAKFIRQAIQGETCIIYGDGTQTRDFLYIDDLVRAVILSMKTPVGGEVFQIATGMENNVIEIALLIQAELAKRDINMRLEYDSPRVGDVKRNYSDTSKSERILNWKSEVKVSNGIKRTLDWFLSNI